MGCADPPADDRRVRLPVPALRTARERMASAIILGFLARLDRARGGPREAATRDGRWAVEGEGATDTELYMHLATRLKLNRQGLQHHLDWMTADRLLVREGPDRRGSCRYRLPEGGGA